MASSARSSNSAFNNGVSAVLALAISLGGIVESRAQTAESEGNSIEAISVAGRQGGNIVVKITLKQPLSNPPAAFSIDNPPRIAFDFPNTGNALGKSTQEVGDGDLRNMNIVAAGDRTRLVMNLAKPLSYDTRLDGNSVFVTLQMRGSDIAATQTTSHFAEAKADDSRHSLRDVTFHRGPNGEGRLTIDLSDSTVGIDLRQQGRNLIIDFANTTLPKNLERRLDASLAQQKPAKVPRIGLLSPFSPADATPWYKAFRFGLSDLGWPFERTISAA